VAVIIQTSVPVISSDLRESLYHMPQDR